MADHLEPENDSADERLHLIGDYINGHMNADERALFEQQLARDLQLAAEYQLQLEIAETVKRIERDAIRRHVRELIHYDYHGEVATRVGESEVAGYELRHKASRNGVKETDLPARHKSPYRMYAVAAMVALALVGSWVLYVYLDNTHSVRPMQVAEQANPAGPTSPDGQILAPAGLDEPGLNQSRSESTPTIGRGPASFRTQNLPLETFSFASSGFGFANGRKTLNILLHPTADIRAETPGIEYSFGPDTLHIYNGQPVQMRVFELTSSQAEESAIELQPGVYLLYDREIYYLVNDAKKHPLIPVDESIHEYLVKHL